MAKTPLSSPVNAHRSDTLEAASEAVQSLADAHHQLILAAWIEDARRLIQGVQFVEEIDPAFKARLKAADIRTGIDWEDFHSNALSVLLAQSMSALTEASAVLRGVARAGKEVSHG